MLQGRPVIFGEVLFDTFQNGESMLGGAPFNVAWHLQGFGLKPLFISRIGIDQHGDRIIKVMEGWGMDTVGVQRDRNHPTGRVEVELTQGNPTYHILPNRAYDYIDYQEALGVLHGGDWSLLYHGTLIIRQEPSTDLHAVSRIALERLRQIQDLPVFLSLNLRPPWWDFEGLQKLLRDTRWCKLNEPELVALKHGTVPPARREDVALELLDQYNMDYVMVTLGPEGAFLVAKGDQAKGDQAKGDQVFRGRPAVVRKIVDTVGAGDAFASVILMGIIDGWSEDLMLQRAIVFASDVCGWCGATPRSEPLYSSYLQRWEREDVAASKQRKYPK